MFDWLHQLYWYLLTDPYEEDTRTIEIEIELKNTEYVESVEVYRG